jgi:6-phosphogluconolactonase
MADVELMAGASDDHVAIWIYRRLEAALSGADGPIDICLPGGGTPIPILEHLTGSPLDWRRINVWPGDDRLVPADHPASNEGQLRLLLEPVGARVMSLPAVEHVPHFTLTWLGMGDDGHIASLFPNTDPDPADPQPIRRITPDPLPPEAPFDRITLTIPALLDADEVIFVIRGEEKQAIFEGAMMGDFDLPVTRLLGAASQKVTCFA